MLLGVELAERVALEMRRANVVDQVMVLQMPPWPTNAAAPAFAIGVTRGPLFHVVAVIDLWHATLTPPASLAQHTKKIAWLRNEGPNLPALVDMIVLLTCAWWAEHPEHVGVIDVAGQITHALVAGLGQQRGTFGNQPYDGGGTSRTDVEIACCIGRRAESLCWPAFAYSTFAKIGIEITLLSSNGTRASRTVTTVHELASILPSVVETLRATDEACVAWGGALGRLRSFVEALRRSLGGEWNVVEPSEIALERPPSISLTRTNASGVPQTIVASSLGRGARLRVGTSSFDVDDEWQLPTMRAAIDAALASEAEVVRPSTLVEKARYRVLEAFSGTKPDDVVIFNLVTEVRPSGADGYMFTIEGLPPRSLGLVESEPADKAVLDSLARYLSRVN